MLVSWQYCIDSLKTELPAQQFSTWIRPLKAEIKSDVLCIAAPNRFILDWIKSKYLTRIEALLLEAQGNAIPLEWVVNTQSPQVTDGQHSKIELGRAGQENRPGNGNVIFAATSVPTLGAASPAEHSSQAKASVMKAPEQSQLAEPKAQRGAPGRREVDIVIEGKLRHRGALNSENNFDNFVIGKSNQLARAAAMQVAENPGYAYNPLFIYGGVGLGKTHLMHAIGNYLVSKKPNAKVVYLHSETFVATMVSALQLNAINEFKRFYRSVDALLIDDIQFFAGKERSQEEFFHTFNALLEGGQQIILTCDRYHKEINGLEERLKSRFGWGLTVAVEPPELETRAAILMNKAELCNVELPYEAALFIAQRLRSNVRELEGALKRVIAHANFKGKKIDLDLIKEALRDLFALQDKLVTIDNIQRSVAEYYKIKMADMLSKRRNRSVARPRQVAMSLSKELTNHSLPEIGDAFGGRDHTTVLHACKQINKLRHSSTDIQEDYNNLLRSLSS